MTSLYLTIGKKLWRKDMQQLLMKSSYEIHQYRELGQIKRELNTEVEAIETLAFFGLVNNIIEFQPWHLKALYTQFPQLNDGHLNKISFLRTSDTSSDYMKNYHFLHLTFQEFFAAQYFIRFWIDEKLIPFTSVSSNGSITTTTIVPEQFLRQEKYTPRYNIMWRFVAGLLSFTNKERLLDFMNILDGEPRDIFGTGHLRILMHCFSEVDSANDDEALKDLQTSVEKRLLRLFLIEVPNPTSGYTSLAREIEFPEHLIQKALLIREPRYNNSEFYDSFLCERFKSSNLPPGLVGALISCQYSELPRMVGHFYQSFSTLPLDYLECPHKRKRRDFYSGLHNGLLESESLPEIIVNRIIQNFHRDQVLSLELLARNSALSIDARTFLLSKVLDLNIPHKELAVLKRGHHFPTQETLLSLLNHDDLEKRARGLSLSRFYGDLDVSVLQRLLILSESQYSASDAGNFTEIYQWIAEALINQEALPHSILHQALDFCHRENFARDVRLMPSCTILAKTSFLQGKDYEALFSNGSWNQCIYQCKELLPSLLYRFKDQFLAELRCKDSVVVSQALESLRWVNYNDLPEQIVESLVEMINHGIFDHASMAVDVLEVLDLPANTARSLAPAIHSLKFPQLFHVFRSSRTLPEDVLTLLLPHLELDMDRSMSVAFGYASYPVIMILRNQIKLPSAIVQNLLSSLESESAPEGATIAAEFIFRDRADFYSMLPGLSRLAWRTLFEIWTDRSVDENLNFYVSDEILYINMPEGSWHVKIDTPEVRGKLQYGIKAAERRLRELEAESCPPDLLDD
ncbi:hypothetical protein N7528_008496 [Penicillium herquei]|nr:hypothetical protein N7528_008496 [Penicillium herquei]